jgi:hypothetical protein
MTVLLVHMGQEYELKIATDHPKSFCGSPVLVRQGGGIVDGGLFRVLRDREGATIRTDRPRSVAQALGVPDDEPGIERL